ncbi:MAG TPA: hypothetical protein VIY73_25615 [Polyangiaceae bacterium]
MPCTVDRARHGVRAACPRARSSNARGRAAALLVFGAVAAWVGLLVPAALFAAIVAYMLTRAFGLRANMAARPLRVRRRSPRS